MIGTEKKTGKRATTLLCALLLLLAIQSAFAENEATLTADRMDYDPETGRITAVGNVHFARPDGELFGDRGVGQASGRDFEMHGNVKGHFEQDGQTVDVACDSMHLTSEGAEAALRKIIASGDVVLTRSHDKLAAQTVTWELDRENYKALGGGVGTFETYFIDADEISRNESQFWSRNIRRYEDRQRRITLSAAKASGLMEGGEVRELIAEGRVVMTMPDSQGAISRITGSKGVFSVARGTIVISGNAIATQQGRSLQAENIVYHLGTERVEALGRPQLIMELPESQ